MALFHYSTCKLFGNQIKEDKRAKGNRNAGEKDRRKSQKTRKKGKKKVKTRWHADANHVDNPELNGAINIILPKAITD